MGCGYSQDFQIIYGTPQFVEWNKTFHALQISKAEVYELHKKFRKVDMDGSGTIDVVELLTVIDVERTPFTERVFSIFDEDKSGKIDFYEFVLSLWNYCTLSRVTLAMFAFDLYDRDSSGFLEEKDIYLMLKDIFGKNITSHYGKQTKKDLEAFVEEKGDIDLDRFLKFVQYHHSLLFPAFQMQLSLKKNILGVRFWEQCAQRRVKLSNKKYVTIKEIIEIHAIQAKADSVKAEIVSTDTGKIAIRSLGITHERRMKYSNSSSDKDDDLVTGMTMVHTDPSLDSQDGLSGGVDTHGKSHQSLASLTGAHDGSGGPRVDTIGSLSYKTTNPGTSHRPSIKTNTRTTMLDNLMNPHASSKSSINHNVPHILHSVKEEGKGDHKQQQQHHHTHQSRKEQLNSPPKSPPESNNNHQNHHHGHHHHGKVAANKVVPINDKKVTSPRSAPLSPQQERPTVKEDMDLVVPSKKNNHNHNQSGYDLKNIAANTATAGGGGASNNPGVKGRAGHRRFSV